MFVGWQRAAREVSLKREKLLRTRQEVYLPLKEICPLDRANRMYLRMYIHRCICMRVCRCGLSEDIWIEGLKGERKVPG